MNSKQIGDIASARVLAALLARGSTVLVPWGDNDRYDLVTETEDGFLRIQAKNGRLRNGVVRFNAHSTHHHRGGKLRGYRGDADLFGVYCPDNDQCYLVPVEDAPKTGECYLRIDQTRNGQSVGVKWATTYQVSPM